MRTNRRARRVLGTFAGLAGAATWVTLSLAVGCSGAKQGDASGSGGDGPILGSGGKGGGNGKGGSGGKGGTSDGGTSGTDAAGAPGDAGSDSMAGAPALIDDGTELDPGADGGGFDGVVLTSTDLVRPVTGCDAFDADSGALALTLDATAPSAIIRVSGGSVTVNGKVCTTADGKTKASADAVKSISVTGGDEDSFVYIDGGSAFGKDLLAKGNGFQLDLGAGTDLLVVLGSTGSDDIRLGADGDATVVDFTGDLVPDIRALGANQIVVSTGPMPDTILGDGKDLGLAPVALPMQLYGGGANDLLLGGAGDDMLDGGIGNDTLLAGRDPGGSDVFVGGDGEDFVDYAGRTAPITVTLTGGADDGEAGENDEVDESVENVRGGDGDDHISGSASSNKLWGGGGNDVLLGGDGDDFIYGGDGDDQIDGGDGDDYIYGEGGNDTLMGGAGEDLLDGYPGVNSLDGGDGDADICVPTATDTAVNCEL
jgi:RTX calcium-binding nonapeptide repeat (4 copies)